MTRIPAFLVAATAAVLLGALGSRPSGNTREATPFARAVATPARPLNRCPIPRRLRPAFEQAATRSILPLALLAAVAETESHFDADAVSSAGAVGAMQVLPQTARSFGLNAHVASENVLAAARYLRRLLWALGSADRAIAAYNAGPTAVAQAGGAPTAETAAYVSQVERKWRQLQGCV